MLALVAIGFLKAIRDSSIWLDDSWLWHFKVLDRWRKLQKKLIVFPLDLWHCAEVGLLVVALGVVEALIALTVFTFFYHFGLRNRPFEAVKDWAQKLFSSNE